MRTLGIDFGLKRVGLALSDPRGALAFPYRTVARTTRDALFAELLEVIAAEGVQAVVVGLPLTLDGQDSMTTRQARNFAASLARRTPLPVALADERLSSAAADDDLDAAGLRGRDRRKAARDQQAAVRILQTYLDNRDPAAPAGSGA
ncbi:Holliday junction resolvase RuvX [Desulfocurvus sp.]|jgi:putative Holliday junction resolvase|uniref:Holliday junction resolvase RuvX n=1 Tax=Desulfocurvus sp. TaxID=2871698 RepID=UPI0025C0D2EE|nr:Holliday junction resolvase RuvX [Desulfocurvus sp.]MCK9240941.1 Holliday junction resolvase RuvX [Desulfocurvus sp.]